MQATDHYRAERPAASRAGLVRGVVVIVTAVAIGAFVMARGIDEPQAEVAAGGSEEVVEGSDPDAAQPAGEGGDTGDTGTSTGDMANGTATSTTSQPSSTTTSSQLTSTTTEAPAPVARPPGEVMVLVLNGSGISGIAAGGTELLDDAGYELLEPDNADDNGPSEVLYVQGFETEAEAVAEAFGIEPALVVAALDPDSPPISGLDTSAEVIVIIGDDGVIEP